MKSKVSVPWYCRKCQTENSDIRQETCDECGEDFPDGWSGTKFHVLKLLDILDQPQGSSAENVISNAESAAEEYYQDVISRYPIMENSRTRWLKNDFEAGYKAALERVK